MYRLKSGTLFSFDIIVGCGMSFNNVQNWFLWTLLLTFIISAIGMLFNSDHYQDYKQSTGVIGFCTTYLLLAWLQNTIISIFAYYIIKLLVYLWG